MAVYPEISSNVIESLPFFLPHTGVDNYSLWQSVLTDQFQKLYQLSQQPALSCFQSSGHYESAGSDTARWKAYHGRC